MGEERKMNGLIGDQALLAIISTDFSSVGAGVFFYLPALSFPFPAALGGRPAG